MHPSHLVAASLFLPTLCVAQMGWVQVRPNQSPVARSYHEMVHDSLRGRTVLFGGSTSGPNSFHADTWEYNGRTWTRINTPVAPPGRWTHGMAFDAARGRTVLFGGRTSSAMGVADTWEYDGTTWVRMNPTTSPPPRRITMMVYDRARRRVVLFGGAPTSNVGYLADTWEYDGRTWTRVVTNTVPPARGDHAMAYDVRRQRTVMFGGFGGRFLTDTWEYDGTDWTSMRPVHSPPGGGEPMVHDAHRSRVSLVTVTGEVWDWDGRDWARVAAGQAPPPRFGQGLAFDPIRRTLVMWGGQWPNRSFADTWEFQVGSLVASPATLPLATGGAQVLTLDAGSAFGGRPYWIFGSMSGVTPGLTLGGIHFPLNPDPYTTLLMGLVNTTPFTSFAGTLSAAGSATATLNVPANLPLTSGVAVHHAFVVLDRSGWISKVSLPVVLRVQ